MPPDQFAQLFVTVLAVAVVGGGLLGWWLGK
jgi:hypothetical protein